MGGVLAADAGATTIASALTDIGTIVTKAVSIITDNTVLFVIFCGGLMGIGFKIVKQAKRAAK